MNHINYSKKDLTVLRFLDFCERCKVPVNMHTLKFFFRSYSDTEIYNSLLVLEKYGRILKFGKRGHYLYTPSNNGREYLLKQQAKELESHFKENVRETLRNFANTANLTTQIEGEVLHEK